MAPLEVKLVNLGVHGSMRGQARLHVRREGHADLVGDLAGHLAIECQDIAQRTVESLRPKVAVSLRVDQLHGDPHRVAGPQHGTLDHGFHAQFTPDFRHRLFGFLEAHCGGPRNHP